MNLFNKRQLLFAAHSPDSMAFQRMRDKVGNRESQDEEMGGGREEREKMQGELLSENEKEVRGG